MSVRSPRRPTARLGAGLVLVLSLLVAPTLTEPAQAAGLVEVTGFGSNPGDLKMYEYVPAGLPAGATMVVLIHGCGQDAAAVDAETGWKSLADRYQFLLVLPESDKFCFGAFSRPNITRGGGGDATSIKQMVDWEKSHRSINASRVFVTGFSSGGQMTNVMLGAYPDVFSAGASLAGMPYMCATTTAQSKDCTIDGDRDLTPQQWGDLARAANPGSWTWPRMLVIHGSTDPIAAPINLREQMEQWTNLNGIDQTPEVADHVNGYPHKVYRDAAGRTRVETIQITGSGHSDPVDVGSAPGQCGAKSFAFTSDVNLCGAYWIARFFSIITTPVPTTTVLNSAAQDGTVKAFPGGSGAVIGKDESKGLQVGRSWDTRHSRAIFSFDTSGVPDDAVITRAWLFVTKESQLGDPWLDPPLNTVLVDVRNGCFGSACTVQTGDYAAAATASGAATMDKPGSDVQWTSDLTAAGRAAVNKTGTTQFRLRFKYAQGLPQHIFLGGGSKARLVLQY